MSIKLILTQYYTTLSNVIFCRRKSTACSHYSVCLSGVMYTSYKLYLGASCLRKEITKAPSKVILVEVLKKCYAWLTLLEVQVKLSCDRVAWICVLLFVGGPLYVCRCTCSVGASITL